MHLLLSLLGTFHATLNGEPVTCFESNRLRALLAYLAVEAQHPHHRQVLAEFLWPDRPAGVARNNLRSALSRLRSTIGDRKSEPPFLLISRYTVQFNPASDYWLDVAEFQRHIAARGFRTPESCSPQVEIRTLGLAIGLYRSPFLEGLSIDGSAPFQEWVRCKREEIDHQLGLALQRLAVLLGECGEYVQAEAFARRRLELEPWSEEAHRRLMHLLALTGQRSAALVQYEACRRLLSSELGIEPGRETTALYESIRDGTWSGGEREGDGQAEERYASAGRSQPGSVALRPVSFVDRDRELEHLDRVLDLALAGEGRVALVSGEAGSGKTALVAEFARQALDRHGDVVVVSGHCSAYGGVGDAYQPFRQILEMLGGDIEAQRGAMVTSEQTRRLQALLPAFVQALLESGPDLIGRFVPAADLATRVSAFSPWPGGMAARAACVVHLRQSVKHQTTAYSMPAGQTMAGELEAPLFEQVTRVLQVLARRRPLILVLDDLQWVDPGSTGLLFHLGRHLAHSRVLLVGIYRPEAVGLEQGGKRHPLEQVIHELQRMWGDNVVDLNQADGRQFVEALLDPEPNRLDSTFRETLYRYAAGNPLFTTELLRSLQEQGDLVRDREGRWIEGPALHWEQLPPRVEAVIAERLGRLPPEWQNMLSVASVEGVEFAAEVVAHALGLDLRETIWRLSGPLSQQNLVHAQSLQRMGASAQRLSGYRFHHHLFQTYLYDRLDQVRRAELHEVVGLALETLYGEHVASISAQLAWHFKQAGLLDKAADYLFQAGK